jgi:hypothetical protein
MARNNESDRPGKPGTTPGAEQPEKRPGPLPQNPARTPATKEPRQRDYEKEADDKMDAVIARDATLSAALSASENRWTAASCLLNRSEGSSTRRDGPADT